MARLVCMVLLALVVAGPASAMRFQLRSFAHGRTALEATGRIMPGDEVKLHDYLATLPPDTPLGVVFLDSRGGNIREAVRLAEVIRRSGLATGVADGRECASACFLLFAAGRRKLAGPHARIGVHSASLHGHDTESARAATTLMARFAGKLGVPSAILGRMVTTPPGQMAWLDAADLRQMGVEVVTATLKADNRTRRELPQDASAGFRNGFTDRRDYQSWFASLTGDARAGAAWWAAHRGPGQEPHASCARAGASQQWVWGCKSARMVLWPFDLKAERDSEYRRGWDDY